MNFIIPQQWGAARDYLTWTDGPYKKDAIAIHYGGPAEATAFDGRAAEEAILRKYEAYHINTQGWRGIAYGWAIGASGLCYWLRGWAHYGAHQGDIDNDGISNNSEIVPVLFILGLYQRPTLIQWRTFGELKDFFESSQKITDRPLEVYGHREVQIEKPTACPGDIIMAGIKQEVWNMEENMTWQAPQSGQKMADTLPTYGFTLTDALAVANYQGGAKVADAIRKLADGAGAAGWLLLLDMIAFERQGTSSNVGTDPTARTEAARANARLDKLREV